MKNNLLNATADLLGTETKSEILSAFVNNLNLLYSKTVFSLSTVGAGPQDFEIVYKNNNYGFLRPSDFKLLTNKEKREISAAVKLLGSIIYSTENANKKEKLNFDFFQNLVNTIPEPVFYKDANGKYLGCNKAFEEFIGIDAKDLIGKDVYELSNKEIADKYYEKDKELFNNPGKQSYEWKVLNASGELKRVKIDKATFNDEDGNIAGIVGVVTDITIAKENEEKLKYRLEIENVLSNISARFFEESETNIDASIDFALKTLGEFVGIDRSYVFLFNETGDKISNTNEWCAPNLSSNKKKFQNVSINIFPWGVKRVRDQKILIINDVNKLLSEIDAKKINLVNLNLKSIIIVPIVYKKKAIGFLGLNSETKEKKWDFGDSHVLKVVSGLISVAFEKYKHIREIKDAEYKFRALVEQSLTGIYIIKRNRFVYVNPKFSEIFGYSDDEIINNCIVSDLVYEEDRALVVENLSKRLMGEIDAIHYLFRGRKKDGAVINVDVHGRRSMLDGESVVIGVLLDITERVMNESSLRKLSKAVEQSSASVLVTDINGNIEYVNPSFTETTGFQKNEVIDRNPRMWKSNQTPREVYENLWKTIKSGNNWRGEILNKKKNGELYWEFNSISPIKNEKGEITHFVAVKEDVTQQKRMIEELHAAKETAEKANKLKSEFLAQISHEIRTPINILLSFSGLIWEEVKDNVSNELKDNYALIGRAGTRIIRTIDLILNLSQVQTGSFEKAEKKIKVYDHFVIKILPEYEYKSGSKGLSLKIKCGKNEAFVYADEYMFEQIFTNLIDNAIKYTEKGSIDINIDNDAEENIYVEVIDTGIGISKQYLPNLFDVFSQEEQGYTRKFEGTGLGLALVKNYCELNNALISVESEKGKGSKFRVTFLKSGK